MKLFPVILTLLMQATSPQVRTGVVAGRILHTTGTPAAGVRVAAMAAPEESIGVPTLVAFAQTDSAGRYRIEGIDPGRYFITAGLVELPTYYPGVLAAARATVVSVTAGTAITGVDFGLATPPAALRLSGRLVFPANQPVPANSRVTISGSGIANSSLAAAQGGAVGSDGTFGFPSLRPGTYDLRLSFAPLPSPVIVALVDQDITGIEIAVPRMFGVSGRLVFPSNQQSAVNLRVLMTSGSGTRFESAVQPEGKFEFQSLVAGTYSLRLNSTPFGSPIEIVLSDRDITGIEIPVPVTAQVAASVEVEGGGAPPPRFSISFASVSNRASTASISAAGIFSISLPEGDYRVLASGLPDSYFVKSMKSGSIDLMNDVLNVSSSYTQQIRVVLGAPPAFKIAGHVTSRPLPDRLVIAGTTSNTTFEAAIQPDGSFEFLRVPPGAYATKALPASIAVSNKDVTDVELAIPPIKELIGRVVVEGGNRVPIFGLVFTPASGAAITTVLDGSSDGVFKVTLPEGEYRVTTTMTSNPVKSLTYGSADLLAGSLVLTAGESAELRLIFAAPNP